MIHDLKTWPEFFQAILDGTKTFEIRKSDRPYAVGDILRLHEFTPCPQCHGTGRMPKLCDCMTTAHPKGTYTGRQTDRTVTYITTFGQPGNQIVMAIA